MADRTCSVDGCDGSVRTRGWCSKHYQRWKKHGDPLKTVRVYAPLACKLPDCDRTDHNGHGFCKLHYRRWKKTGDPYKVVPPRRKGVEQKRCGVPTCIRQARRAGLCAVHSGRLRRHGDPLAGGPSRNRAPTVELRFVTSIRMLPRGCWEWTGQINGSGYGLLNAAPSTWLAHRWAYEWLVGPISDGLTLDHLCHTNDPHCPPGPCRHRRCVNPAHLEPVTQSENARRVARRKRRSAA
jgi:hypothetical protein